MSGGNQAERVGSPDLAGAQPPGGAPPARRRRRGRRIALISAGSVFALLAMVAVGGYVAFSHLAGNVKRIPGVFTQLDSAHRPVLPAATAKSMTILLTGSGLYQAPRQGHGTLGASTEPQGISGLIALVHFDADRKAASVVSIPSNAEVNIPGHGRSELQNALALGGPSLLIDTVQQVTDVPIDHYSVVDFAGLNTALRRLGGVTVDLPAAITSDGFTFQAGPNVLTTANVLAYVRQTSLSSEQRAQRQQALLRAIVQKVVSEDLIKNPLKDISLLDAFTSVLSVDSNFSNAELYQLSGDLHLLRAGASTFVTAPVLGSAAETSAVQLDPQVAGQLWQSIRNDSVAAFAAQHPETVTPAAPS